ncbi:hypothetical protein NFI96_016667, partial [Prochilodus magdalenae]
MSQSIYKDMVCTEELRRGDKVEMVVAIYDSLDAVRDHESNTEMEDTSSKRSLNIQQPEMNTAVSRCYRLAAVCLGLLCVLLLAFVTVLGIKFNSLTKERDQLQTSYTNLTIERDQLHISYTNLTIERDQLQTSYTNLTIERDQLQTSYTNLTIERDQLQTSYTKLTIERNQFHTQRDTLQRRFSELAISLPQAFIEMLRGGQTTWIGLSAQETKGIWKWVDGSGLTT